MPTSPVIPWVLSDPSRGSLLARARDLRAWLRDAPDADVAAVGCTLADEQPRLGHRAVLTGRSRDDFERALAALEVGAPAPGLVEGFAERREQPVFVFPPHGPEWAGMGRELLDASDTFRRHVDACAEAIEPYVEWSLLDVLRGVEGAPGLERCDVAQPAILAVSIALAELLRSHGVEPAATLGHSIGDVPAAYMAGGLSLDDAARVMALWSRAQETLRDRGGMASVQLPPQELLPRLEPWTGRLNVAAYNGPGVTVVTGDREPLERLLEELHADGVRAQRVSVPLAAHSPHIDEIHERMLSDLAPIAPRPGRLPFYSSFAGGELDTAALDAAYWPRALREVVEFERATRAVLAAGHRVLIEVSPHPVLTFGMRQTADAVGAGVVLGSMRRGHAGPERIAGCLAEAWVHGVDVDWSAAFEGAERARPELPRRDAGGERDEPESLRERLLAAPAGRRAALAEEVVRGHVAAALGLAGTAEVPPARPFKELGLDSAGAVELAERLGRLLEIRLPPTAAFDHPSAAALAERVLAELLGATPASARARRRPPAAPHEPIAIVGIGCRFPGDVASAEQLWRLLDDGIDAIGGFPTDRGWDLERLNDPDPERPGACYVRTGGFLYDAPAFDADLFGISPREALGMDPQQRVLLQVAWEALEDAGIDPRALRGSDTGVFAGMFTQEYGPRLHEADVTAGYALTGSLISVASGRLAYSFGLEGPALTIDTACSSSMVALHHACAALRQGECSLALAGGVTVLATPGLLVEFSRQRGLAPDGRCKAFGAGADGTGFAEGAGLLVLERLSDAREAGRDVLAVVRGSAVNQDGASNGLTAPNGPSQERVIRQALANARLSAADVDAAEAHGTGTTLGDPIEARALIATYGQERSNGPLRLGSLKSNIGHTNAAAGVAGVIKMVQALRYERLPRSLHCEQPSPHVDWSAGEVELLREPVEWPRGERPRRAGVSSFGISGTNAHLILEEAPHAQEAVVAGGEAPALAGALPFVVSGAGADALAAQAGRLASFLDVRSDVGLADVATALATRRAALPHRAVAVARDHAELTAALRSLERGEPAAAIVHGVASDAGRVAFLFSGQGSQWPGMGAELRRTFPVFADALDEVCAAINPHLERPLLDVMLAEAGSVAAHQLSNTRFTQVALFALEVALYRLVRSFGLEPDHLIGHSIGEFAAAHVAGVLSLPDACLVVAERAHLMAALPAGGAMLAVEAAEEEALESLSGFEGRVALAAVNGPRAVTLSGEAAAVSELNGVWRGRGRRTTRLDVSHAFHSQLMEPMLDELRSVVAQVELREPAVAVVSNVTGEQLTSEQARSPDYWVRQVREPVRFADGIRYLREAGVTRFLELGPDGVLSGLAAQSADAGVFAPVLRGAKVPQDEALLAFLGAAHCDGLAVDWGPLLGGRAVGRVELPTYAFQGRRFWLGSSVAVGSAAAGLTAVEHPLLGSGQPLAGSSRWLFTGRLSIETHPWLADHRVAGTVLLPGTAFAELALVAAAHVGGGDVEQLALLAPLVLDERRAVQVQVVVREPDDDGRRSFEVHSRPEGGASDEAAGADWTLHASGSLGSASEEDAALLDFAAASWPPESAEELDVELLYERLADVGYEYGPAFRGLRRAFRDGDEWYAEVALADEHDGRAARFRLDPALGDATLHTLLLALLERHGQDAATTVPFSFSGVRLRGEGCSALRVRVTLTEGAEAGAVTVRLLALDEHGAPVLAIEALEARAVDRAALAAQSSAADDALFAPAWVGVALADAGEAPPSAALLGSGEDGPALDFAELALARYPDVEAVEELVAAGAPAPDVLLVPAPAADGATVQAAHATAAWTLALLQARLRSEPLAETRLVLLTHGALAVRPGERPNLGQAALLGLLRSAASEHPGVFAVVDLDRGDDTPAALLAALGSDEPELAIREGSVLAPRLAPAEVECTAPEPDPDGTVLITGGTRGLGALVARHLAAEHGARRLLLVSRSGADGDGVEELVDSLAQVGCEARVAACDVADRGALEALLSEIPTAHPLTAVFHAAGLVADGVLTSLDEERLTRVMAPKVDGALNLHELTADLGLAQFVLFSSVAATLGVPGQANYAAANAFLDALAQQRHAEGRQAVSLAWGTWDGATGMTADVDLDRWERAGIAALSVPQGLALLDAARGATVPLLAPVRLARRVLRAQARAGTLPAILRGLFRDGDGRAATGDGSLAQRLAGAQESERQAIALELVLGHVAGVLKHGADATIDSQRAFKDLGFDSLSAVELRNRLGQATGLTLPATLVFDYATPAAVAELLVAKLAGSGPARVDRRSRSRSDEPIAIVGMSCRYPGGVRSPGELWELVLSGTDAIGGFPTDRGWDVERLYDPDPDHAGTSYTRHGGFLYDAGDFDPDFFSISPREALAIDPQHRLLLEGAWEALEDAGIDPSALKGSGTGVFAGVMHHDYGSTGLPAELEGYVGTGGSLLSGRLAYALGLEGPAVSVDTACSSSLVALHLACQSLRQGECDLALAGGATVLATPTAFVQFSRQRALAPDGRCKAFGAGADGTAWSEGAGLLVLERLSDAHEAGHHVLATVRGSAVNQDGASNGLTAPNGPSQERVIRQALAVAGLSAADVDAVEAHGTGTALGDPIEAQALLATYGRERSNGPLYLGSLKSNIGHTQAAAGVAGVIKMVQALRHGLLPRSLHCEEPSPHVDWSEGDVELLAWPVDWSPGERARRAGVSSFGISGTNAHVILEEGPRAEAVAVVDGGGAPALAGALPFVVSAAGADALAAQAGRLASFLDARSDVGLVEVAAALATRRAALPHRAVAVAGDRVELTAALRELERGGLAAGTVRGVASDAGRVAFLFSGQGSQWPGMGAGLRRVFPVFADALEEVCAAFDPHLERPLLEVMFAESGSVEAALLSDTRFTQVALFALEVALFRLLVGFGVRPDFLIGHSVGELAAAHVAGVFSLADGCRLVAERARLMAALPAGGAMLAVEASEVEALESLAGFEERVALAAVNGPLAVTVSGEEEAIGGLEALWRERGRRTTRLEVSHAFHSPLMEPMLAELEAVVRSVELSAPLIPVVSNVTGEQLTVEEACSPGYWVRHVRQPVRFADGVELLARGGVTRFLELGPNTVLAALAAQTATADEQDLLFAPALRGPEVPQDEALLAFLGAAHCHGVDVDWSPLLDGRAVGRVELPTYAFQRRRYWLEPTGAAVGHSAIGHPLLSSGQPLAGSREWLFTGRVSLGTHSWLADHEVAGVVVLPGMAFVELALLAARHVGVHELEDLTLLAPLVVEGAGAVLLQVSVKEPEKDGRRLFEIYSRREGGSVDEPGEDADWILHASGLLGAAAGASELDEQLAGFAAASWPPAGAEELDVELLYEQLADVGYEYGPAFRGLRRAFRDGDAWYAEVALTDECDGQATSFRLHPALGDAALHGLLLASLGRGERGAAPAVPFSFAGVCLRGEGCSALRVRVVVTENAEAEGATARLLALDEHGSPALAIEALETRPVDPAALRASASGEDDALFALEWTALEAAASDGASLRVALLGSGEDGRELDFVEIALERSSDLDALEGLVASGVPAPDVVLVPAPAPAAGGGPAAAAHEVAAWALGLLQARLRSELLAETRLVLLTDGALAVLPGERPNLAQAALVGLLRSAASEHPGVFALVDGDRDGGEGSAVALSAALESDEPELAIRAGRVLAPRLARAVVEAPSAAQVMDPDGTVLITGGTHGLGALVARHLAAEHGARRLLLVSRRGADAAGVRELVASLAQLGCEAWAVACDVADRAQLQALLAEIPAEHPLTAVVHAAGVLADGVLTSLDEERLRRVMAPKVDGAVNLHELTADLGLARFVLFSSVAATLGTPGQGNYAAANAFLDALAQQRRADGLPAVSLAWGPWESATGMTAAQEVDLERWERAGIAALSEQQGLALLDAARGTSEASLVPVRLERWALRAQARAGTLPAILRGLFRGTDGKARVTGGLARRLAGVPEAERRSIARELVLGHVAGVLKHGADTAIDPQRAFKDLGFDSLSAIELRNRLSQATGLTLPATLVFDYATPAAVAELLVSKLAGTAPSTPASRRRSRNDEPIAIVGMSCRYPGGVRSPGDLWDLVVSGTDAIGEFPADRGWDLQRLYDPDPDHAGTSYARHGGFVYDAGEFDSEFFSISPREALAIDPQHRLLLEGAWEALEDAGIDPSTLSGSDTGVFAGVMYGDYGGAGVPAELEGYVGTGGSLLSGRLAYALGLEGPAVSVDTACSSSLVALHLACQSLRQGECDLALAGGATVLATPTVFVLFSRQRALAPDGRCRAYGAGADGTAWSEGAGLLVLERLSDAREAGHRVLATVRGSAVNQDGASNGLTAPNGPSQERVIRQALANARLSAADVDAVEGHGTGTALGDPIEAQALIATYGQQRSNGPLRLGSLKSNIGHTQAAAGVAGVIKMVQALRHGLLPRSLHCEEPSPHVDWSAGEVELLREPVDWLARERPRRAAVSSFGISGTNAHVILEETPSVEARPRAAKLPDVPFVLSGRSEAALQAQAERLRGWLAERPELEPADVGFSLATGRAQLEHRAVVVASDSEQLVAGLGTAARGDAAAGVVAGQARDGAGAAFVFPGQGSQWEGMALELLGSAPVFAAAMSACGEALSRHVDWSLEDVLRGAEDAPSLERVDVVQPALFAVMVSLAALWRSCGVEPSAVVGHSQGEIAAAHVAGGLSLEDAARVVALRSRAIADLLSGRGGMVSVALAPEAAAALIEPFGERLSLAAVNGPASVVVSGEDGALDELLRRCEADDVWARRIPVDYPSHSVRVEDLRERLLRDLAGIEPRSGTIPFFSTVAGAAIDTAQLDADYWYRNLRQPVRFDDAVGALIDGGTGALVEASPHPGLTVAMTAAVEGRDATDRVAVIGSLRRDDGGLDRFLTSLAEAHVHGIPVDWSRLYEGTGARRVDLPTYAFQRRRYWLEPAKPVGDLTATGLVAVDHPLVSAMLPLAGERGTAFSGRISLTALPWLRDHAVLDRVLLPATAFAELLLAAGAELGGGAVEELTLEAPLVLAEGDEVALELLVAADDGGGRREVEVHSRTQTPGGADGDAEIGEWIRHARGVLSDEPSPRADAAHALSGEAWPPQGAEPVDVAAMYDRLADAGFGYGPAFQGVVAAWRRGEEMLCEVALDEDVAADAAAFGVHPALLDASFHALLDRLSSEADGGSVPLPFALSGVRLLRTGATSLRMALTPAPEGHGFALVAADEAGRTVLEVDSLALRPIDAARLGAAARTGGDGLFRHVWVELPHEATTEQPGLYAVLGEGLELPPGATPHRNLSTLVEAIEQGVEIPDAVLVAVPDPAAADDGERGGAAVLAREGVTALLAFLQVWLHADAVGDARLVLVTRGAMAVSHGESPDAACAALWGLARSAQSEHPERFVLVDLEAGVAASDVDWAAVLAAGEPQVAVRGDKLLGLRLARLDGDPLLALPEGEAAWHLDAPRRGTLEGLALVASPRAGDALGPDEVRVAVRAGGLNFRDVLIALGLYPDDDPIGSEGAGVVLEVGAAVTDLAVGDRVMGLMEHAFGPVAVTESRFLVRLPAGWSFAEAASVPVAFLTAYYGLVERAGLREGERLLVHAGAGGVGMAAIGLARHLGAEVWATASPEKWHVLRALGVDDDHIASSRDLEFRDRFLAATAGEGVDVVLNALAGAAIDASLDLLPRGGRFLEMGKADRRDPERIRRERPGVDYCAYDVLRDAGHDRIPALLGELLALFEAGALRPLPVRAWDVRHAFEAFRHLGDGRSVGKVVLTVPRSLDPEGTVLITGGTGDLGARVARHLAGEHGVRRLLLVSRQGHDASRAAELVEELRGLGADPRVAACDVTDRGELAALLEAIDAEHPLTAVVHTAGVLDDGLVESLTPEQVGRVLAPKADAALLLHELTLDGDLAEFVVFSSDSGTVGIPGQANYAAANVFLDALVQRRRTQGLPGTSLAWGLWSDATGMAGNLGDVDIARLARLGAAAMSNELELFDAGRAAAEPVVVPTALDMPALRAAARAGTLPPLMREIVRARPGRRSAGGRASLADRLAGLSDGDRADAVLQVVREEAAVVLGYESAESIDPERKFKELGFDSLGAVELRNRLAAVTGMRLPSTLVFDHPNPVAAAGYLLSRLAPASAPAPDPGADEHELRRALASIPVERLRAAGLLDQLLRIADRNGCEDGPRPDEGGDLEHLDADDLVRLARTTAQTRTVP